MIQPPQNLKKIVNIWKYFCQILVTHNQEIDNNWNFLDACEAYARRWAKKENV